MIIKYGKVYGLGFAFDISSTYELDSIEKLEYHYKTIGWKLFLGPILIAGLWHLRWFKTKEPIECEHGISYRYVCRRCVGD
jgi:hypothetical protein